MLEDALIHLEAAVAFFVQSKLGIRLIDFLWHVEQNCLRVVVNNLVFSECNVLVII